MRKPTVLLVGLVLSGCATGDYDPLVIESRYQRGLAACQQETVNRSWCFKQVEEVRSASYANRWSLRRFLPDGGGAKTPTQVYVVN